MWLDFWSWFVSSPPAATITAIGALVVTLRVQSNREHRRTGAKLDAIGSQLNGDLLATLSSIRARLSLIEHKLGIREESN